MRHFGHGRGLRTVSADDDDQCFPGLDCLAYALLELPAALDHVRLDNGEATFGQFFLQAPVVGEPVAGAQAADNGRFTHIGALSIYPGRQKSDCSVVPAFAKNETLIALMSKLCPNY